MIEGLRQRHRAQRGETLPQPHTEDPQPRPRSSKSFAAIQREHLYLEKKVQEEPFSGEQLDQLRSFMQDVAFAGLTTRDGAQRDRLRAILRQWATWMRDKTGRYPAATLEPWKGPGWLERIWPWVRRGLVAVGLVTVVWVVVYFGPQVYDRFVSQVFGLLATEIGDRIVPPTVAESDILIIVADFDDPSQSSDKVADRLEKTLDAQMEQVRVRRLTAVITNTFTADDLSQVFAVAPVVLVIGGTVGDSADGPIVTPNIILASTVPDKPIPQLDVPALGSQSAELLPYSVTHATAYVVGQLFASEQRYQPALAAFSIAIQEAQVPTEDTNQPLAGLEKTYLKRAEIYDTLKEWEQALSDYTAIIDLDRKSVAEAFLQRAIVYNKRGQEGDQDRALQDVASAIEQGVDDLSTAYYLRGLILFRQQDYTAAIAALDQAIALDYQPLSQAYYFRGSAYSQRAADRADFEQALKDYNRALEEGDYSRPDTLYVRRGYVHNQLGEYALAEEDFEMALKKGYPDVAEVQYHLGIARANQENYQGAVTAFSVVIDQETPHPRRTDALYRRGVAYLAMKSYAEAAGDFSTLLAEDDAHPDAHFQRALALFYQGQYQAAVSDLTVALGQDPDRTAIYYWRGQAYAKQGHYQQAIEDLTIAINKDVYTPEAHYYRGLAFYKVQDYDAARYDLSVATESDPQLGQRAIAHFDEIIAPDPASPTVAMAYYMRGYVYLAFGDEESLLRARADFNATIDPQWATEFYRGRATTSFALQDYQAAVDNWTQALAGDYPYPEDHYWRGLAYLELSELERAIEDFTRYLEADSTFQQQPLQPTPTQSKVYLLRGNASLSLGDYEHAKDDFNITIRLTADESEKAKAYLGQGKAHFYQGEYKEAQTSLDTAITLDPAKRAQALDYFSDLIASQPQARQAAAAYYMRAHLTYDESSQGTQSALDNLTQSILADPTFALSYFFRGQIFAGQGNHTLAIADYSAALVHNHPQPAQVYHARGVSYYEQHKYDLALEDFDAALALDPNLAGSRLRRGLIYFQQESYSQAIENIAIAIRTEPFWSRTALNELDRIIEGDSDPIVVAHAYYVKGRIHLLSEDQDRLQLALDDLTQAIQRDPSFTDAYYWRGLVHFEQQNYQQAINDFGQTLEQDNQMIAAYYRRGLARFHLADYDGTLSDLTKTTRLDPNKSTQAIAYFTTLIETAPDDPTTAPAYYIRGRLYQAQGDDESQSLALENFTVAILRDPTFARARYDRGLLYARLNAHAQAIADFTGVIELDYNVARAYYYRGLAQVEQDDLKAAIADFTAALEQDTNLTDALYQRGLIFHRIGDYTSAIADYTTYLDLVPNSAQVYFQRGLAYASRGEEGDRQQAIADFTQALALDPDWADALFQRGLAHAALDNQAAAVDDFTAALEVDPTLEEALYRRGLIRLNEGEATQDPETREDLLRQAVDDFGQVIALRPEFADAYYNRARAYRALDENELAQADFETYLKLMPNAADRLQVEQWIVELREMPTPAPESTPEPTPLPEATPTPTPGG